jgi:hypothetical protein
MRWFAMQLNSKRGAASFCETGFVQRLQGAQLDAPGGAKAGGKRQFIHTTDSNHRIRGELGSSATLLQLPLDSKFSCPQRFPDRLYPGLIFISRSKFLT